MELYKNFLPGSRKGILYVIPQGIVEGILQGMYRVYFILVLVSICIPC